MEDGLLNHASGYPARFDERLEGSVWLWKEGRM